jgi:hypothetical protein
MEALIMEALNRGSVAVMRLCCEISDDRRALHLGSWRYAPICAAEYKSQLLAQGRNLSNKPLLYQRGVRRLQH